MDCTQTLVELFCHSFPEIDRRVIKATVLEYGNDIESAINDLVDISDQIKDTSFVDSLKVQCCSLLCPAEDAVKQVSIEEEKSQVVGLPSTDCRRFGSPSENLVPDASDSQRDFHSAYVVEHSSSGNNTIAEPLAINGTRSETLDNSIDIANVASSLECTIQETRTDIDDVIYLIKEVGDLQVKADQERVAAQNAVIEAGRGGEDLLMKACEVNKQTQKMKQDNVKLSLEIHGEKSVLALEAEELNVRLEKMKEQKEKAVTTLHEIRDTLQSCYDTALEDRKMAEEDRQLKEEKAAKVLEQEEDLMAIIVQETKTLKMEAEACSLLRDFLVDHGSIVDVLQGEINNLCEDVKYLKEQVKGVRSSMNAASNKELAQNSAALYSLRSSNSSLSASSGEMTHSLASQSGASTLRLDLNRPDKSQFLYSSGTYGSVVSRSFDGITEDGSISYMNNGRGSRGNMPMQELPFIENSYNLEVPGLFPFRYGTSHQHDAYGEHADVTVDTNMFGVSPHHSAFGEHRDDSIGNGYSQGQSHQHLGFGEHGDDSNGYDYMQGQSHQHRAFGELTDDSNGYGMSHHQHRAFGEHRDDSNGYGMGYHRHHAFGKHGDVKIDSNRYGYPHVAWQ